MNKHEKHEKYEWSEIDQEAREILAEEQFYKDMVLPFDEDLIRGELR